jgi:NitT/TauT family transport system permease protein
VPLSLIGSGVQGADAAGLWSAVLALGFLVWCILERTATLAARSPSILLNLAVPGLFGLWLLYVWEVLTGGFAVPKVLLPPPSDVGRAIGAFPGTLADDFVQTFIKSVIPGYIAGNLAGFATALAVDRYLLAADRRPRTDHGHVVRLRLAVESRHRRHHDILPDAR